MSRSARLTLSVVVCCYSLERWELLQRTIASLRSQARPIDELILVVDHNDLLFERLRGTPDATVVTNEGRRGLSDARNSGVRVATGDVVAFVDDDVEASPSWSHRLMRPYADRTVLGVGGQVVPRFESTRPIWLAPEMDWVVGCTYAGHRSSQGPVRNFIGANMSFRRSMFDSIAGFRNDLGRTGQDAAGCEETELCIRATRELGGAMFYQPEAIVTHFVPDARATRSYMRARCRAEGRSKATIAQIVGKGPGLASERSYLTRALPAAVRRELAGALFLRGRGSFGRIRMIVEGVLLTAYGYLRGRLSARSPGPPFDPVVVAEVDVDHPDRVKTVTGRDGGSYRRALALARRGGRPVGVVEVDVPDGGLASADFAGRVAAALDDSAAMETASASRDGAIPSPFVSVVIATRDRPDALGPCLESVARLDYPAFEVVVVDNCPSTAETADLVARFAQTFPQARYVREDIPGLGRAHNRGLRSATGTIVAFTDDDVVVDSGWLRTIVDAFASDSHIGCVTGMIMPAELETQSQAWLEGWAGFLKGTSTIRFADATPPPDDALFPFAAGRLGSGANMAFRADVLRAIGGFDPALGAGTPARGGDDLAVFFDVIDAGYVLAYEPSAVVFHAHRPDYASLRRQAFGYGVGMGAYATHLLVTHPRRVLHALKLAPPAARHYFSPRSAMNARRPPGYPRELVWRQRAGLVAGPWSYLRSRRAGVGAGARRARRCSPGAPRP